MNKNIADEIQAEQKHGRAKYGDGENDLDHDDEHGDGQWYTFIADHNERANLAPPMERRQHLVKIAGLAVSAIEAIDRTTTQVIDMDMIRKYPQVCLDCSLSSYEREVCSGCEKRDGVTEKIEGYSEPTGHQPKPNDSPSQPPEGSANE